MIRAPGKTSRSVFLTTTRLGDRGRQTVRLRTIGERLTTKIGSKKFCPSRFFVIVGELGLQATGQSDESAEHFRWLAEADAQLSRVRSIEDRLSKDPHDTTLRYELGRIRLHYSSPEEGVRMLLSVLDISPDHAEARQALAEYYRQQGDERLARRFADHGDEP